jgi:hypothetical protein
MNNRRLRAPAVTRSVAGLHRPLTARNREERQDASYHSNEHSCDGRRMLASACTQEQRAGCVIKGNISSSGERIYHVPGQRYYDKTRINWSKGERWFCTEQEAVRALAASLMRDARMKTVDGFINAIPGDWIERFCCRVNILVPAHLRPELLSLLEAFLHVRLKPLYEG